MAMNPILPPLASKTPLAADRYQKAGALPAAPPAAGAKDLGAQAATLPLGDQAQISSQAHRMAALRETLDVARAAVAEADEVRADRVELAKQRVASGYYESPLVRDQVAARLLDTLVANDLG